MSSFFFQAEDGIRDLTVTGVQTCALPISRPLRSRQAMSITRPAFPMPSDPFVPELPPLYLEDVRLRLAEEADYAFLRALYRQVRAAELAPVPWSEAEKHAFCDSQFALQDQHYRKHYAHSAFFVIERA